METLRLSEIAEHRILWDEVLAIYSAALPLSEQKSAAQLQQMLGREDYLFHAFRKDGNTLGFSVIYAPAASDYCLLEYIATDANYRNAGIGSDIFRYLSECFSERTMLMEVESPYSPSSPSETELRQRRMRFYARQNSRYLQGLNYILPLNTHGTPPEMLILLRSGTHKETVQKHKVSQWLTDIYVSVYGQSREDARLHAMLAPLPEEIPLIRP